MQTIKKGVTGFRVLLFAAGISTLGYASIENVAQVFVDPTSSGGTGPCDKGVSKPGHILLGCSATGPASQSMPTESGNSSAEVGVMVGSSGLVDGTDYRQMKLFASGFASIDSTSRGVIRDELLFTDLTKPIGTIMDVQYKFKVHGDLSVDDTGLSEADWGFQSSLGSGGLVNLTLGATMENDNLPLPGYHGDPIGTYTAIGTVQNGLPAQLDLELTVHAQARFGPPLINDAFSPGGATANFLNTFDWGGIESVTVGGQPVDYTLSSGSGTDWSQAFVPTATPEPASGFLAAGLLAGIWLFRRKLTGSNSPSSRG